MSSWGQLTRGSQFVWWRRDFFGGLERSGRRIGSEHVAGKEGGVRGIERSQNREGERHASGDV